MKKYILKNGKVIETENLEEWANWFETSQDRVIEKTQVSNNVEVSTVFL